MMKKEDKHNCPTDMIFSKKRGKCIQPDLEPEKEIVDGDAYPERRNHSDPNLDFPTHKKRGDIQKI